MTDLIIKATNALLGWIKFNRDNTRIERQKFIDALVELHRAANLTRLHLADVAVSGVEGDPFRIGDRNVYGNDIRSDLSNAWRTVAGKLMECSDYNIDPHLDEILRDLYQRCFEKGNYWADPAGWKDSGVDIQLGNLVSEVSEAIEYLRKPDRNRPHERAR